MSDGAHGHGTTLAIGGTAVGNIISVSGPDQNRDSIDTSTMDSANKWREFIPGMLDAGEVSIELNYDGSAAGTANFLNTQFTNPTQAILVTFPDTSTWSASGFMTALGHAIPFDDKITQSVTFKMSGTPTYTDVA